MPGEFAGRPITGNHCERLLEFWKVEGPESVWRNHTHSSLHGVSSHEHFQEQRKEQTSRETGQLLGRPKFCCLLSVSGRTSDAAGRQTADGRPWEGRRGGGEAHRGGRRDGT